MQTFPKLRDDLSEIWSFIRVDETTHSLDIDAPLLFAEIIEAPTDRPIWNYLVNSERRCREMLALQEELEKISQQFLYSKLNRESVEGFGMQCKNVAQGLLARERLTRWSPLEIGAAEAMPFEPMPWYICPVCMDGDLRQREYENEYTCVECEKRFAGPLFDKEGRYWCEPHEPGIKYPLIRAAERG
jgi:hypothetical protein